ncbi:hypothetical protein B5F13_00365 [Drancourtella sp. An177]|nr:hypothetical protein B5F13_00365 [Drancourtella sp. An177]
MLTLLFVILLFVVFSKLLVLSIKAAWGITKIILTLICLPIILVVFVIGGLIYLALPVLIIIGIVAWAGGAKV